MLRKIRAKLFGYFWIHCPICDEEFGGFEIGKGSVDLGDGRKRVCCKGCDYTAGQIDGVNNPYPMVDADARKFFKTALGQSSPHGNNFKDGNHGY